MVKRVIKISVLALCALGVIYLIFGGTLRRWLTPPDTVVGRVGEDTVTLKDVNMRVDYGLIISGYSRAAVVNASGEMMNSISTDTLDYCISKRLFLQKAKEMGLYPLSENDQIAVAAMAELNYQAKAVQLKLDGVSKEDIIEIETENRVAELLEEKITENVTVTDAEIKAEYDELLAKQQPEFTRNAVYYESYINGSNYPPVIIVFRPEGYRLVRQILVPFPDDVTREITEAMRAFDEDEIQRLRDENLPKIKAQAEEVLAKAQAGEDFDALMKPLMEHYNPAGRPCPRNITMAYSNYMLTEYEVGTVSDLDPDFAAAACALARVGDMTGLVATRYGYHIIKWVGNVPSGPVPFEEVKDAIKASLLETKKDAAWKDAAAQWEAAINIEKYPDRIP